MNRAGTALLACGLLAVGVLIGAVTASLTITGAPSGVTHADELVVPVATTEIDDSRPVQLTVSVTEREPLRINTSGTVTAWTCRPGTAVKSGGVIGSVNGRPVRLLATTVPLWRDLRLGDRGDDVVAVQAELRRMGFNATRTGRADARTASAVRRWLTGSDARLWSSYTGSDAAVVLPLAAVVWSPLRTVTPTACGPSLGAPISTGDAALTPAPDVSKIAPTAPLPLLPGRSRVLNLGRVRVPVDAAGAVTDREDLAALTGTAEFAAWLAADPDNRRLVGTVALDQPILVAAVPPAAVLDAATQHPCLLSDGGATTEVRVVSSRLGQSLVAAADPGTALPSRVVVDRTGNRTCPSR